MPVWGPGAFENDDAADWARRFQADGESALDPVFREVNTSKRRVGLAASAEAVAAAEVLAAGLGRSVPDSLPEAVREVLAAEPIDNGQQLVKGAQRALARVRADSDLLLFWQTSPDRPTWEATVEDLQQRLSRWSPVENATRPGKGHRSAHPHQTHPERLPIEAPPERRADIGPRPPAYSWFLAYCWLVVGLGGFAVLFGFLAIVGIVRNEGGGGPADIAAPLIALGILSSALFLGGIFLPRRPSVWVYDLVLILLGTPGCLVIVAGPLLFFWLKRDMRTLFGLA